MSSKERFISIGKATHYITKNILTNIREEKRNILKFEYLGIKKYPIFVHLNVCEMANEYIYPQSSYAFHHEYFLRDIECSNIYILFTTCSI